MPRRLLLAAMIAAAMLLIAAEDPNFTTWDANGGGADHSQYSSLKQISRNNVQQLQVAWMYESGNNPTFNPVVVDGTMYVGAQNAIVAIDAATGKELWKHPGSGAARGITYWESKDRKDRRLLFANAGALTAIDARTGETIQSFGDNGRTDLKNGLDRDIRQATASNPGHVFENTIFMSLMPSNQGDNYLATPGDVHAYDVITGKLRWVFHSVPHPGEVGYETWPPEAWKTSGGVHNWNEMSVDETRGIVFIPFGTARYDFYGPDRHGQDLFGNSIVALDARTGKRLWHFQTVHHDLWDYDLPAAPKLLTVKHDGKNVDVVAQPTKQGFLFVFERETGKPLWPIEEHPVPQTDVPGEQTWPTQPFPTRPPPFARQSFTEKDINPYISDEEKAKVREMLRTWRNEGLFTPPSLKGSVEIPGNNGGANWGSSGVDPTKGMIYIVSKEMPMGLTLRLPGPPRAGRAGKDGKEPPPPPPPPRHEFTPYDAPYDFMIQASNGLSAIGPPWSQLTAIDLNTGTIKWQVPNGRVVGVPQDTPTGAHFPRGGVVVTGGGLIFGATSSDRKFRAYDQDNGKVVWEYNLPAGSDGVPAVYDAGGREYVVIPIGGAGMTPPRASSAKELPPTPGGYLAFALLKK